MFVHTGGGDGVGLLILFPHQGLPPHPERERESRISSLAISRWRCVCRCVNNAGEKDGKGTIGTKRYGIVLPSCEISVCRYCGFDYTANKNGEPLVVPLSRPIAICNVSVGLINIEVHLSRLV